MLFDFYYLLFISSASNYNNVRSASFLIDTYVAGPLYGAPARVFLHITNSLVLIPSHHSLESKLK